MKNVKSRIEKAREKDGPVPRSVAVSLTVCDIIFKSCKFSALVPCCENNNYTELSYNVGQIFKVDT